MAKALDTEPPLDRLRLLLENLPIQLPRKTSGNSLFESFLPLNFSLNQDLLEKTGSETSALSKHLKRIFGWQARTSGDGVVSILERGDAVLAMHQVLSTFSKKYPDDGVLQKWINDIIMGAEKTYELHNTPVRCYVQLRHDTD